MNKTTIAITVLLGIIVSMFSYCLILQDKVNANEEILALQKRNIELDKLIEEEQDWWWVDESARNECMNSCQTSWTKHQEERSKLADSYRLEKENNEKRLGLLLQR